MTNLICPVGILFGIGIQCAFSYSNIIFIASSSGTFLFVSASEVMIEEFTIHFYQRAKFISFFGGIFIVVTIIYLFFH